MFQSVAQHFFETSANNIGTKSFQSEHANCEIEIDWTQVVSPALHPEDIGGSKGVGKPYGLAFPIAAFCGFYKLIISFCIPTTEYSCPGIVQNIVTQVPRVVITFERFSQVDSKVGWVAALEVEVPCIPPCLNSVEIVVFVLSSFKLMKPVKYLKFAHRLFSLSSQARVLLLGSSLQL